MRVRRRVRVKEKGKKTKIQNILKIQKKIQKETKNEMKTIQKTTTFDYSAEQCIGRHAGREGFWENGNIQIEIRLKHNETQ